MSEIAPLYHEGHECCRKCVIENHNLKQLMESARELRDSFPQDHSEWTHQECLLDVSLQSLGVPTKNP